jgi:hypothetical protein
MDDLHCKINPLNVVVVATIPIALFSGDICRDPHFFYGPYKFIYFFSSLFGRLSFKNGLQNGKAEGWTDCDA